MMMMAHDQRMCTVFAIAFFIIVTVFLGMILHSNVFMPLRVLV